MDIKNIYDFKEEHFDAMKDIIHEGNHMEAWALRHMTGQEALRMSIDASDHVWTGMKDEIPIAMFGIVEPKGLLGRVGTPWLICSAYIDGYAITFLRGFKKAIPRLFENCDVLMNYVDARNVAVTRMVQWVGFQISPPRMMGLDKLPFLRIEMERGDCRCA